MGLFKALQQIGGRCKAMINKDLYFLSHFDSPISDT